MFKSSWIFGSLEAEAPLALRRKVFVEEQGIAESEEFDRFDGYAAHVFVEDEISPIAAGRMYPAGDFTYADRICVHPNYRKEPYDELVLRIMLDKAQQLAGKKIAALLTQEEAKLYIPFGFAPEGETISARNGARKLYTVDRDSIIWDSPCKHM